MDVACLVVLPHPSPPHHFGLKTRQKYPERLRKTSLFVLKLFNFLYQRCLFWGKNSQHLVQMYQVLAKIDLKIQYFDVQNWITQEPIKISFSNFQVIFVMTLGQNDEEQQGVAVQPTKPCPSFWSRYFSWRLCRNECNFQNFSKIGFAC